MASYTTNLIDWGATGTAYPAGYSYLAGEQAQDGYDNFVNHNVVEDIQHLVALTNARLESSKAATRPVSPEDGELFYDTDGFVLEQYRNGAWVTLGTDGDLQTHIADTGNPHAVTAAQAGAIADSAGSVTESHLSFAVATQAELDAHSGDTANPHAVTAAQAGALAIDGTNGMTANLQFNQNEACKMALEVLTADPATPVTGQVWFRSDLGQIKIYDGAAVQTVTSA